MPPNLADLIGQNMNKNHSFPNFTRILCDGLGLSDIAPKGKARQSSISKWSRDDDAQRAVSSDSYKDFAFHTDHEETPWWELAFDTPQSAKILLVSNRRRTLFQDLARSIRVEISPNGKDWNTIHEGDVAFGAEGEGVPLILPLDPNTAFKLLRISLGEGGALHLSKVRVLARRYTAPPRKQSIVFATERTDGLGERLKGLLNAMVVSDFFKADFVFEWPSFSDYNAGHHAVDAPEQVFSADFLGAHFGIETPKIDLPSFLLDNARNRTVDTGSVMVPHHDLETVDPTFATQIKPGAFAEAFDRIAFSDRLVQAIDAARALDLGAAPVALHLRAGDIVYGRYRFNRRYTNKVVPYPLCLEFIQAEREAGRDVLLFGQDADLCRQIATATGARFTEDFHVAQGFDQTQAALFDIVAMSRCARVVAGASGFSQLAQRIGGFEMIDPRNLRPAAEAARILRDALLDPDPAASVTPPPLQTAFAAWYTVYFYGSQIALGERIDLLRLAIAQDPVNAFYGVMLSIALFENGQAAEAEAGLRHLMSGDIATERFGSLTEIARTVHPNGAAALDAALRPLEDMAEQGVVSAAILAAVINHQTGKEPRAARLAALAGPEGEEMIARLSGPILR